MSRTITKDEMAERGWDGEQAIPDGQATVKVTPDARTSLNEVERRRVARLRKRIDTLRKRASETGEENGRTVAELSALVWIVEAFEALRDGAYQPPVETKPSRLRRMERLRGETR